MKKRKERKKKERKIEGSKDRKRSVFILDDGRHVGDLVEEVKLSLVEALSRAGQRAGDLLHHLLQQLPDVGCGEREGGRLTCVCVRGLWILHVRRAGLTVFLVCFLVQVYVGLHVPDELVGQKLGLLSGPQDVLPHVAHLRRRGRSERR